MLRIQTNENFYGVAEGVATGDDGASVAPGTGLVEVLTFGLACHCKAFVMRLSVAARFLIWSRSSRPLTFLIFEGTSNRDACGFKSRFRVSIITRTPAPLLALPIISARNGKPVAWSTNTTLLVLTVPAFVLVFKDLVKPYFMAV